MPIDRIPGVGPTNADIATAVAAPSAATIAAAVAAPSAATIAAAVAAPSAATIAAAVAAPSAATIASTVAASVPTLSQINSSVASNASPFGGSWTTIINENLGTNPTNSLTISGLSSYKYLRIVTTAYAGSVNWRPCLRFNGDTGGNYSNVLLRASAGTTTGGSVTFNWSQTRMSLTGSTDVSAGSPPFFDIEIRNANSSSYKLVSMVNASIQSTSTGTLWNAEGVGLWNGAAISSLTFLTDGGQNHNGGFFILLGAN